MAVIEPFLQLQRQVATVFERLRQALDEPGGVELVMNVFTLILHVEFQPKLPLNEAESQRFNEDARELFRELEKRKCYWLSRDDMPFPERRARFLDDVRLVQKAARIGALAFVNEAQRRIARDAERRRAATARIALAESSAIADAAVRECAQAHWTLQPSFRDNAHGTATKIQKAVNDLLAKAGLKPATVNTIRKRVAKLIKERNGAGGLS